MSITDPWPAPYAAVPVRATVRLPGSKSLTNRELVLAAIADGPSVVHRALRSRDTELMAAALTSLGAEVDTSGADWSVRPLTHGHRADVEVDCGLAGTVMRFVPPVAALIAGTVRFDGDPHARTRPMAEVLAGLEGRAASVVAVAFMVAEGVLRDRMAQGCGVAGVRLVPGALGDTGAAAALVVERADSLPT